MITRPHTKTLFSGNNLNEIQSANSISNIQEMEGKLSVLHSFPRRIVLELTNSCNINCIMCGRNYATFTPVYLDTKILFWLKPLLNIVEEVTLMGWGEPTVHPQFTSFLKYLDEFPVRKYICTNGMNLSKHIHDIFNCHVDILAISINGATAETNNRIRIGSDLEKIKSTLKSIQTKKDKNFPYLCLVYCLMRSNIHELDKLIDLAIEIGVNKIKIVHFTAFSNDLIEESLLGYETEIKSIFTLIARKAIDNNIKLELPYIKGEDPAGDYSHRECFTGWRDFYVGADGFVRPCMSTSEKICKINLSDKFEDVWNSPQFIRHRNIVNKENEMSISCVNCYQSTFCNWNKESSYIHIETEYSPNWNSSTHYT